MQTELRMTTGRANSLWRAIATGAILLLGSILLAAPPVSEAVKEDVAPPPKPLPTQSSPGRCADSVSALFGPSCSAGTSPVKLPASAVEETDVPLPINLATALRLADARPLVI